jgi:hypothetical protein
MGQIRAEYHENEELPSALVPTRDVISKRPGHAGEATISS